MEPKNLFRFCPRCGGSRVATGERQPFRCGACDLVYYFNPTLAVAGFLRNPEGSLLFVRRSQEPARGKLALPGGFVDLGERVEEALRREVLEEVNLELEELEFLCSQLNSYLYREVTYPVVDLFFSAKARSLERLAALDGVAGIEWRRPESVSDEEIAFPSIRMGLRFVRERLRNASPTSSGR